MSYKKTGEAENLYKRVGKNKDHLKIKIMKKYLFGVFAIALAIGFSAFTTTPHKSKNVFSDVFFEYQGPNFTQSEVIKPANWVEVSDLTGSCTGVNENACRIKVASGSTDGSAPSRTLKSTVVIPVAQFSSSIYYVTVGSSVLAKTNTD
jgi:hypothetical protein